MYRASNANCLINRYSVTVNRNGAQKSQMALTLPDTPEGRFSAFKVGSRVRSAHDRSSLLQP